MHWLKVNNYASLWHILDSKALVWRIRVCSWSQRSFFCGKSESFFYFIEFPSTFVKRKQKLKCSLQHFFFRDVSYVSIYHCISSGSHGVFPLQRPCCCGHPKYYIAFGCNWLSYAWKLSYVELPWSHIITYKCWSSPCQNMYYDDDTYDVYKWEIGKQDMKLGKFIEGRTVWKTGRCIWHLNSYSFPFVSKAIMPTFLFINKRKCLWNTCSIINHQ